MNLWKRYFSRGPKAQVLMEFALILPFALFLFTAIVEVGGYIHRYVAVQTAVREGARVCAELDATDDQIRAAVIGAAGSLAIAPGDVQITRRPLDPEVATLPLGNGESIEMRSRVPSFQTVEVRVSIKNSSTIPVLFHNRALGTIAGCVRTLQVAR